MKILFIFALTIPSYAFAKTSASGGAIAEGYLSKIDAPATMRASYDFLQKLHAQKIIPSADKLINSKITLQVEQRAGGYYITHSIRDDKVVGSVVCSAPIEGTSLDFQDASCETIMGD